MAIRKPKLALQRIRHRANSALELARAHGVRLEPRLGRGVIEQLGRAVEGMLPAEGSLATATTSSLSATERKRKAIADTWTLALAIRRLVCLSSRSTDVARVAYGVNTPVDPRSARAVGRAVEIILSRAQQEPEEAKALGILPRDVAELRRRRDQIDAESQGALLARFEKPRVTQARNELLRNILRMVGQISAAGALEFAQEPEIRERFEALDDVPRRRKKNAETPEQAPPPRPDEEAIG